MKDKSDDQVKDQCVAMLRKIFPKEVTKKLMNNRKIFLYFLSLNSAIIFCLEKQAFVDLSPDVWRIFQVSF